MLTVKADLVIYNYIVTVLTVLYEALIEWISIFVHTWTVFQIQLPHFLE